MSHAGHKSQLELVEGFLVVRLSALLAEGTEDVLDKEQF